MTTWALLVDNIESLSKEHSAPITKDLEDLADLSSALALTVFAMMNAEIVTTDAVMEIVTTYIRIAYSLGRNRGKGEAQ